MQLDTQNLSDETLLSMILTQQPNWRDLLSVLLRRSHNSLVTRCYLYLRNRQDAEDAAQETELRVFRAITGFRGESAFKTWLYAIADRQCHDMARKRMRHVLTDQIQSLLEIHEESLNFPETYGQNDDLVGKVLDRLPNRERDILVLRFYVDLSLKDMANYLDIGLSATKMRLYRALELFGVMLQDEQKA